MNRNTPPSSSLPTITFVVSLGTDQLAAFAEALRPIIASEIRRVPAPPSVVREWMDDAECATEVGYARSYLPTLIKKRGLPVHRRGRKRRYRSADVALWLERQGDHHGQTP